MTTIKELNECSDVAHGEKFDSHVFPLTDSKRELILHLHNGYRSAVKPTAANMKRLMWSASLEKDAVAMATTCNFESDDLNSDFHKHAVGINQDFATGEDGKDAIIRWWEEKDNFNVTKMNCLRENQCRHYVQCGLKVIPWDVELHGAVFSIICLFVYISPAEIFLVTALTLLANLVHNVWSRNDLLAICVYINYACPPEICAAKTLPCECGIEGCHNCGHFVNDSCRCECKEGWDAADCSMPCKDKHGYCGKAPGWQGLSSCTTQLNRVRDVHCRHMCGQCVSVTLGGDHCCNGHMCQEGAVLSETTCECVALCPGIRCGLSINSAVCNRTLFWVLFSIFILCSYLSME